MSEVQSASTDLADDLAYIRSAVARRDQSRPDRIAVYASWAIYVLIGYTLTDVRPAWAGPFFALAWIPAALVTFVVQRRRRAQGEIVGPREGRLLALHWGVGTALAIASAFAFCFITGVRGVASGQIIVVMIGLVYFLGGVHFDRRFLVLGPVMIAGGLLVGFIPHYPWTILGIVIAAGLVVPSLFGRERSEVDHVEA
jgi:hypothetical protein